MFFFVQHYQCEESSALCIFQFEKKTHHVFVGSNLYTIVDATIMLKDSEVFLLKFSLRLSTAVPQRSSSEDLRAGAVKKSYQLFLNRHHRRRPVWSRHSTTCLSSATAPAFYLSLRSAIHLFLLQ